MEQAVDFFAEHGYVIVPSVLAPHEVAVYRDEVLRQQAAQPEEWRLYGSSRDGGPVGESGRWQSSTISQHTDRFDPLLSHPSILPLARRLIGDSICLNSPGTAIYRDAVSEPAPKRGQTWPIGTAATAPWPSEQKILWQMWHREMGGLFFPEHEFCLDSLQVRVQLSDTDPTTHAVSVVPESVVDKKSLPYEPRLNERGEAHPELTQITGPFIDRMWRNAWLPPGPAPHAATPSLAGGIDIYAQAGDAILINNCSIHAGTVRQTPIPRIDIRFDYGHRGQRQAIRGGNGVSSVPPRLVALNPDLWVTDEKTVVLPFKAPAWVVAVSKLGGGHVLADVTLDEWKAQHSTGARL